MRVEVGFSGGVAWVQINDETPVEFHDTLEAKRFVDEHVDAEMLRIWGNGNIVDINNVDKGETVIMHLNEHVLEPKQPFIQGQLGEMG